MATSANAWEPPGILRMTLYFSILLYEQRELIINTLHIADTSFNFIGNSPIVIARSVLLNISFGTGVIEARCELL